MKIIIVGLILTNFASIVFVGKYKSMSDKAINVAREAIGIAYKVIETADAFEQKFYKCVKVNSKKKRSKK